MYRALTTPNQSSYRTRIMTDTNLMKICTVCQEEKPLDRFYKLKSGKYGVTAMCKPCYSAYIKTKPNPYTPDPNAPTPIKRCTSCQQEKPITDFYKDSHGKYGVKSICKLCSSEKYKYRQPVVCVDEGNKLCALCKEEKSLDNFYKHKTGILGRHAYCKKCFSEKNEKRNFEFDSDKFGETITCSVCKEAKHHSLFHNRKASYNGKAFMCKDCQSQLTAQKNNVPEENYEKQVRLCTGCLKEKFGSEFRKSKNGRGGLHSQCKECYRYMRRENKGTVNANTARRRSFKKQAIPKWYDKCKVDAIYEECTQVTKATGVEHHVDHIVPLQSKWVCGLHCEDNLRIITASENSHKLNSHWPNMPDKKDRSVAATKENIAKLAKV